MEEVQGALSKSSQASIYLIAHCQDYAADEGHHQQGWSQLGSVFKASLAESCTSYGCSQRSRPHTTIKGR